MIGYFIVVTNKKVYKSKFSKFLMEKYNLPSEEIKRFEVYRGAIVKTMSKLIADGRVPMNVSQLMQRRLDLRNDNPGVKAFYIGKSFDTGDAIVYHSDGRVKIVLDSQHLREMTPESQRSYFGRALFIGENVYNTLEGEEFGFGELGKVNNPMSKKDVKAHPVWKVLARDQNLLNDYADYIFAEGKKRFKYNIAMGVYLDSSASNDVNMMPWFLDRLEDGSVVGGMSDISDVCGHLVGIAPEALSAPGKGVSNIKAYTMADLQAFDKTMNGLEATVRPELLEPFVELRKKL